MRTFILRDFSDYDISGNITDNYGSIRIYITKNNFLEVTIDYLHEHDGIQAHMIIKYNEKLDIYDTIINILDKISYDIYYQYNKLEPYHKDFILHDHIEIKNPDIWINDKKHNFGNKWIYLTRENIKYVTIEECEENFEKSEYFVIRGEVSENGIFTYDYPIVDSRCSIELYNKSRGNMNYFYDLDLLSINDIL